ncbi:MAG: efflux RND transporter permease subunit [Spirochaetia bacterium]|nr:efflux RND transporter permease subunit [Spirochaetia bacterium]
MNKWDFCIQHPFSVLICWLGVVFLGICSLFKLDIGFYPEVSIPYATITAEFPGIPADEVEKLVTIPLENTLSAVKNIRQISSTSKRGECTIRLELSWDADMTVTGSDIRNKIDAVYPFLPESVSRPVLSLKSFADSRIMTLAVFPKPGFTLLKASTLVEKELKSRILTLDGVAQVLLMGCIEPEVQVDVNYNRIMSADSLDMHKVAEAIRKSIFRYPVGNVEEGEHRYPLRAETDIKALEDLCQIPLDADGAMALEDVASVVSGEKEQSSFFCHNGKEGIGLKIIKTGGSSLLKTCHGLRNAVKNLSGIYDDFFEIEIIEDNSKSLEQAILSLAFTIGAGIISACIVIVLLMQNRHIALIVISALPFSLFPLFVCMHCAGISLNIITLSALAIGAGMVFDNSVVVIGHLLEKKHYLSCAPAVIGSTITTIIIFVPIILLPGLMGKVFESLAATVILFLAISCIVSLTLTPALYTLLKKFICYKPRPFAFERWYSYYLDWSRSKKGFLVLIALITLLPLTIALFIPFSIVPETKSDTAEIQVDFPYGYPFNAYTSWACALEKEMSEKSLCKDVTIIGGYDRESGQDLNTFIFRVQGGNKKALEQFFNSMPWKCQVLEEKYFLSVLAGNNRLYYLTSPDRDVLEKELSRIEDNARADGVSAAIIHGINNYPEYKVSVSDNIYSAGLTPADIFEAISMAGEGIIVAQLDMDGNPVDVRLRYGREFVDTPEKISSLVFKKDGKTLFVQPFIKIGEEHNSFVLDRLNRQNALFLTFLPDTGNGYGAFKVSDVLSKVHSREILVLFTGAVAFIWFVLAVQFESCRLPFLILCTVPMGVSGSLLALFMTGKGMNISSVLGLMILSGTAVNSGILILSDIIHGVPIGQAALHRLRTVCITLFSTVTALLPVALFDSNPIQSCASVSLLGGLVFGTAALFALVPALIKEDANV